MFHCHDLYKKEPRGSGTLWLNAFLFSLYYKNVSHGHLRNEGEVNLLNNITQILSSNRFHLASKVLRSHGDTLPIDHYNTSRSVIWDR